MKGKILGKRFGDLETLKFLGGKGAHPKYLCKCHKCGETLEVSREAVLNAAKLTGCKLCRETPYNRKDRTEAKRSALAGSVVGSYHVIAPASTDRNYKNAKLWLAACRKCGREHILSTSMLLAKIPCVCESEKTAEAVRQKPGEPTVNQANSVYPEPDIDMLLTSFRRDMQAADDKIRRLREEKASISQMCESFKSVFSFA